MTTRHHRARTLATATAGLVCALSLAACSGSGDTASAGTPDDSTQPVSSTSQRAACTTDDLSFSVSSEDAAGDPVRHLLLTATNAGEEDCTLHHHPIVQLGTDAQAPAPVIEESDPDERITLAPGDEAYAAVLVSGGAMDEYEVDVLLAGLQGREDGGEAGELVSLDLPGDDPVFGDDGQRVTYWTTASGYALDFVMSL